MTKAVLRDIEGEAHNYVLSGSQTAREQPTLWTPRVMHMKGSMEHPIHGYRPKPAHLQDAPRALIHGQNFEEQPRHERWRVSTGMRPSFTFKDNTAFVPCPPTDLLKKDETKKKKKRKPRKGKNPNPADRSVQQTANPSRRGLSTVQVIPEPLRRKGLRPARLFERGQFPWGTRHRRATRGSQLA